MKIAIRKESNGSIYFDKTALERFSEEKLKQPPYDFKFIEVNVEDFEANDFNYDLTFNAEKYNVRKLEVEKQKLRTKREGECFSIINRGELWYSTLTENQKTELAEWYQNWLNVTETKVIPTKPSWIK